MTHITTLRDLRACIQADTAQSPASEQLEALDAAIAALTGAADAQPAGHVGRDASMAHMNVNLPEGSPVYAAPQPAAVLRDIPDAERHALIGGYFADQWAKDAADGLLHHYARALAAQPSGQAQTEPLARYCPGCGSVGPVEAKYRDCCPDGNEARMIPKTLAEKCRDTFKIAIRNMLADAAANDGGQAQPTLLTADHTGMMVDHSGVIRQAKESLEYGMRNPSVATMLEGMGKHLEELGRRWYAGDVSVVDEFLQLYCVADDERAALKAARQGEGSANG
ncbi:hypothetical protein IMZ29_01040 [Achromobacter sp. GG226]|uniref:hypothetical protein n=1 Tax=Verticiella alkaliphila TaxID=2779529 RepID=UPI001C0D74C5|nr:hypothetical protein [Verticiella sp. GG226]MBU4609189.1 hypothetical protein [Verticiella sp. GG226]